jgi:hypothetical protein
MADGWIWKVAFYFMEIIHEPLHLDKWGFVYRKIIFFEWAFGYGGGLKFWGYVGTNSELFCAEFWNFVQCHVAYF